MPIIFYPYEDDLKKGLNTPLSEKIELLLEAAERYKAAVMDTSNAPTLGGENKRSTPADIKISYNWEGIAQILREVRALPEANAADKKAKQEHLLKMAEVYEVLRGAKMQKLEAVRLALINEANHLRGS